MREEGEEGRHQEEQHRRRGEGGPPAAAPLGRRSTPVGPDQHSGRDEQRQGDEGKGQEAGRHQDDGARQQEGGSTVAGEKRQEPRDADCGTEGEGAEGALDPVLGRDASDVAQQAQASAGRQDERPGRDDEPVRPGRAELGSNRVGCHALLYVRMSETRERLLVGARRCIVAKGLARTTSRDIAGEAAANLAAITYHFGSKDELVAQALLDTLREWLEPTLCVLAEEGDPPARAMGAIATLVATFEEHREDAPALLQALVESPRIPTLQAGVAGLLAELGRLLAAQMVDMDAGGLLAPWVEPDAMAALIVAVAAGLVLQVVVDPNGPAIAEMAAQFGGLLLAVRGRPGAP